jgi:hypothetical protein
MKFFRCIIRHNGEQVRYVESQSVGNWTLVAPATDACLLPLTLGEQFMAAPGLDSRYELVPIVVEADLRKKKPS